MKIPKEKPRPEKTGDSKTPRERVKIFSFLAVLRTTANSLKYNKDILKKQESLQNIL